MKIVIISRITNPTIPSLCDGLVNREDTDVMWLTDTLLRESPSDSLGKKIPPDLLKDSYLKTSSKLKIIQLFKFNRALNITTSILEYLRKFRPDILIFHYSHGFNGIFFDGKKAIILGPILSLPLIVLSKIWCKHIVFWAQEAGGAPIVAMQCRIFYPLYSKLLSRVIATQKQQADVFVRFGFCKDKICVVPEPLAILPEQNEEDEHQEIVHHNMILCFGAIEKRKGIHLLVEAMPTILKAHPKTRLVIAGMPTNDKYLNYLKALINKMNLKEIELMPRFLSHKELTQLISQANIISNLQEETNGPSASLGVTATFKKCTILSDTNQFKEHVVDGYNGRFVEQDVTAIAKCFIEVLNSPNEQKKMGNNLNMTFLSSHDNKRVSDILLKEFAAIIANRSKSSFVNYESCLKL